MEFFFNDLLSFLAPVVFATSLSQAIPPLPCGTFFPQCFLKLFHYGLPKRPRMCARVLGGKQGDGKKIAHELKVRDQINEQTFIFLIWCDFLLVLWLLNLVESFLHSPRKVTDISLNRHGLGIPLVASKLLWNGFGHFQKFLFRDGTKLFFKWLWNEISRKFIVKVSVKPFGTYLQNLKQWKEGH